ncbi:hypothetical protein ACQPW1_14750 [Nocardia sp. CA-128927]|uniref:hypothetical protein n=1 Tax=Nocardia sp. CA-128927 TaxID=3239975 RepID=UPI003D95FBDE
MGQLSNPCPAAVPHASLQGIAVVGGAVVVRLSSTDPIVMTAVILEASLGSLCVK